MQTLKSSFTLTQIEYALAVHKYGHFAKAAEACHVTQPTLSMQIQKLEEDLDVVLFDRSKKPILLTEKGARLIEQMQSLISEAKKIESLAHAPEKGVIGGALTLGVIPTIAPYILPRLLPEVSRTLPKLELTVREMQTHRIVEALQNDDLDVGLLATPLDVTRILEIPLYYETFYLLCQKNHELAKLKKVKQSLLKSEDIWLLEEGHCLRNQILDVCSIKKSARGHQQFTFESGSIETLKSLVDSFGGYTLVPYLAREIHGKKSQLIEFERPIPARQVGLVYRREHHKLEFIEALGDAILGCLPEELRKIRPKDLEVLPVGN